MSEPIIEVENLTKRYRLGVANKTLREAADHFWRTRILRNQGLSKTSKRTNFFALRDVSFSVKRGEILGVIGGNGAGKSTLLKILSRITDPTSGEVRLRGKVSSLLEVGTGFHPELSGRENIYLNGAILGMRRSQIARRFDQIVAFADIDQFLDTPVKHYSSGMYVRLAFAVAAHLEPEVLIVDEVLAVGDQKFQEKCIGKMHDIASSRDRTVLFVSHNLANIRELCTSAILLQGGQLTYQGEVGEVISAYNQVALVPSADILLAGNGLRLVSIRLFSTEGGETTHHPIFNRNYILELVIEALVPLRDATVGVEVAESSGLVVASLSTVIEGISPFLMTGTISVRFRLDALPLVAGAYTTRVNIHKWFERVPRLDIGNALHFEVQSAMVNGAIYPYERSFGIFRLARGVAVEQVPAVRPATEFTRVNH